MAINYDRLMHWPFAPVEQTYTEKETLLYALGVGFGADPLDEGQLRFVFEERDFVAVPTMAAVLGTPGFWLRDPATGVDWRQVLHGEQRIELHRPLPVAGTVLAQTRVTQIIDKGTGRGALIYTEREIRDSHTGARLATLSATTVARGEGGFGGPRTAQPPPHTLPKREPDAVLRTADRAPGGAGLPPLRRPEPAARRPGGGPDRRFRCAYPPRVVYARHRWTCRPQDLLRLRPGAFPVDGAPIFRARLSG